MRLLGRVGHRQFEMADYRRRLPHFHPEGRYLFVTWRLWGTLPGRAGGPEWLRDERIAELVSRAVVRGDGERRFYELSAWVVMPNHVHVLVLPRVAPPEAMRWLKGSTARAANLILGRTGQRFWQDESFDHYLRDKWEMGRAVRYIENNPVRAGLVRSKEEWKWGSAGWESRQAEAPALPTG